MQDGPRWRVLAALGVAVPVLLSSACQGVPPPYDATKPHHRPGGFQNNYLEFELKSLGSLLRWRWDAISRGLPPAPLQATPVVAADLAFVQRNAHAGEAMQPAITWVGHATMLAQFSGLNVVTDPMFSERASPLSFLGPRRAQPPGLRLDQMPRVDIVLISHNHYDHLDEGSVDALQAQRGGPPLFIVPLGIKAWLSGRGVTRVVELDWWQSHRMVSLGREVEIVLTPAQHWSGRGLHDRLATLWGGFAVFASDVHFFYSGDTGYSKDFADIRRRFSARQSDGGFDIALIPVGAYEPRWFMAEQHVDPAEALRIHQDLGAKASAGVHWGTFELTDEPLDEPPRALAEARRAAGLTDRDFFLLAIGETRVLPRRASAPVAKP